MQKITGYQQEPYSQIPIRIELLHQAEKHLRNDTYVFADSFQNVIRRHLNLSSFVWGLI